MLEVIHLNRRIDAQRDGDVLGAAVGAVDDQRDVLQRLDVTALDTDQIESVGAGDAERLHAVTAFELARQHTLGRVQGGGLIIQHQMVQHILADMMTNIEAARLLTWQAATTEPPDLALSSMAKVFASDMAVKVATDAVQLMGAYGTTLKSGADKYFRDAKMTQILEGTNEICRLAIAGPLAHQ